MKESVRSKFQVHKKRQNPKVGARLQHLAMVHDEPAAGLVEVSLRCI